MSVTKTFPLKLAAPSLKAKGTTHTDWARQCRARWCARQYPLWTGADRGKHSHRKLQRQYWSQWPPVASRRGTVPELQRTPPGSAATCGESDVIRYVCG